MIVAVYLREKKSSLTYSPSNLFGQPLLIGIPRQETNYEQLYDIVLNSLSRYVTTPDTQDEWWKKPAVSDKCVLQNGVGDTTAPTTSSAAVTNGDDATTAKVQTYLLTFQTVVCPMIREPSLLYV